MVGMMFIAVVKNGLIDYSKIKVDTTDIFIFAGIILAAIGAIWGIRKMIILGYISSIPGHWQKMYEREQERLEREQDFTEYREFRDSGGFASDGFGFNYGGRHWHINGFGSDSDDNLGDEFIGSVGGKSYFYDKVGDVYSNFDEVFGEEIENNENENEDIYGPYSYESWEGWREGWYTSIDDNVGYEADDMPYMEDDGEK